MSEAENIVFVMNILKVTEEIDIDFFMLHWVQCESDVDRRDLVRSFRNQIAQCAIGASIVPLRAAAPSPS